VKFHKIPFCEFSLLFANWNCSFWDTLCREGFSGYNELRLVDDFRLFEGISDHEENQTSGKFLQCEAGPLRAVVTGGAGFLGSHLCEYLLNQGWEVLAIDNLVTGTPANLRHFPRNVPFAIMQHDVSKFIDVPGPVDYVLHFASPASPVDYLKLPIQTLKVGSLGTHNTLGLALAKKAKYFLASTSECYGDPAVSPQPETYWGNVNTVGPRGVYDEAKRFAEAMTMAYHRAKGLDTHIVRIFNTYGPRMRLNDGRALPNFVHQALTGQPITVYGTGKQTRSFCYVSDLIEGIYRLMMSDEHEPTNVGNPYEITILEFAERVRSLMGVTTPIIFEPLPQDDPKQRCPDISKARRVLGWEPKVNLEEGLKLTLESFKKQFAETQAG
jgi:dTDP-glucose 4,6-dehydratase